MCVGGGVTHRENTEVGQSHVAATTWPAHGPLSQQDASGFGYFSQLSLLKSQANPLAMNLIISYSWIVFFLVTMAC